MVWRWTANDDDEKMLKEMAGGNSGSVGFQEADAMRNQSDAELLEHRETEKDGEAVEQD